MCLGIPWQIVDIADADKQWGRVEIAGTTRPVYLGLLAPETVQIGTWISQGIPGMERGPALSDLRLCHLCV